jgi:DNA repair ATPase RecN
MGYSDHFHTKRKDYAMRTENQIKSKINELSMQKKKLQTRLAALEENSPERASLLNQETRLDDMMIMLEWVLFEPNGSYHM